MSIKAMTHVWDHSTADGTELICLLALADWCNDEGFCYPGIKRLAAKCRVSERGVQKVLERLIEKGEIQIEYNQGKAVNGGNTNRYYLAKYRDSIGETGGVVNVGSPGGVNGRSGGVVNVGSPKPLVYPSDKTIVATQPDIEMTDTFIALKKKHEGERAVIHYGTIRKGAQALIKAGWTTAEMVECVEGMYADPYYLNKNIPITLQLVGTVIATRLRSRSIKAAAAAPVVAPDWMTYQISEDNQWTGH